MTNSRAREQSIERLLRQSSRRSAGGAVTDACLDPELLAAWADGGLSGAMLELAQAHAADCSHCQALVGTLARLHTAVPVPAPERVIRGWRPWLVPLATAAVALSAVALWVTIPRSSENRALPGTLPPLAAPPLSGANAGGSADQAVARSKEEQRPQPDQSTALSAIPGGANAPEARDGNAASEAAKAELPSQPGALTSQLRRDAASLEAQQAPPAASAAGAAAPPSAAAARSAAGTLVDQPPTGKTIAGFGPVVGAGAEIRSPDPAVRWRIAGSTVQRTTDGGSSWRDVTTGFQGQLTAGAAPSPSLCWLVGRGGFMLLASVTGSGVSWRRVSFPEPIDLSAVRASDDLTASVTSVDGRTFATADGGATWVRVTPQDF